MFMSERAWSKSTPQQLELVILIGLQASGKTTFYREYFGRTHRIISKDLMGNARGKGARQERMLDVELGQGHSVVLDNTNPTVMDRAKAIAIGKQYGAKVIGYYFVPDVPQNLRRNSIREGRACVPEVAIYSTAKKLETPTCAEGFDEIWEVEIDQSP